MGKRGPKTKQLTAAEIAIIPKLAEILSNVEIAQVFGCSKTTLKRNWQEELSKGRLVANLKVMKAGLRMASSGKCWPATQWWLEKRCKLGDASAGDPKEPKRFILEYRETKPGERIGKVLTEDEMDDDGE